MSIHVFSVAFQKLPCLRTRQNSGPRKKKGGSCSRLLQINPKATLNRTSKNTAKCSFLKAYMQHPAAYKEII